MGKNIESQQTVDVGQQNGDPADARLLRQQLHYDSSSWVLAVGNLVIKKFRHAAVNQQLILEALQQAGWPIRLDDPLPRAEGIDPRDRLANAVRRLNRNQSCAAIRFRMDGTGQGIRWTLNPAVIGEAAR